MPAPLSFSIDFSLLALDQLPPGSRSPTDAGFKEAVQAYFIRQFEPVGGLVQTEISDTEVAVRWYPPSEASDPRDYALELLQSGNLAAAVPLLRWLVEALPEDVDLLFNLGMAESDLGQLEPALAHLRRALELEPSRANTWVAVGVAESRQGHKKEASEAFDHALAHDPGNPYALRNKAALLLEAGALSEAEAAFREARRTLPEDPALLYGLAQALEKTNTASHGEEIDSLYRKVLALNPPPPLPELAEKGLSRLAQRTFRAAAGSTVRMDAVMYCLGALEKFERMERGDLQQIAFEIALLGRSGLDVNDSAQKYTLRTLPGRFSGLHLVSLMYVAFKILDPQLDGGFDLSVEYEMAKGMQRER